MYGRFPVEPPDDPGAMTLRDWFAGQAITAMFVNHGPVDMMEGKVADGIDAAAKLAYFIADAMLAERVKKPKQDEYSCFDECKNGVWTVRPGTSVSSAIAEAIKTAKAENTAIRFGFNGSVIAVDANSQAEEVMRDYYKMR